MHCCKGCCCGSNPLPILGVWIIVIVIVGVIGALIRDPPETIHQSFRHDHSKLQYISIGGGSTTANISSHG
nr:hypothetical protein 4 [Gorica betanecrovirus 1]